MVAFPALVASSSAEWQLWRDQLATTVARHSTRTSSSSKISLRSITSGVQKVLLPRAGGSSAPKARNDSLLERRKKGPQSHVHSTQESNNASEKQVRCDQRRQREQTWTFFICCLMRLAVALVRAPVHAGSASARRAKSAEAGRVWKPTRALSPHQSRGAAFGHSLTLWTVVFKCLRRTPHLT